MAHPNDGKNGLYVEEVSASVSLQLVNVAHQLLGASQEISVGIDAAKLEHNLLLAIKALQNVVEDLHQPRTIMTTPSSAPPDQISKFERLPGELRNKIYKLVLRLDFGRRFKFAPCERHRHPYAGPKIVSEGLLRTRSSIYNEAVPYLYSSNFFQLEERVGVSRACKDCWQVGNDALLVNKQVEKLHHVKMVLTIDPLPPCRSSSWPNSLTSWGSTDIRDTIHYFTGMKTLWLTITSLQDAIAIAELAQFVFHLLERGRPAMLETISIRGTLDSPSVYWEQHLSIAFKKIILETQAAWSVDFWPAARFAKPLGVPLTADLTRLPHILNRVVLQHKG